MRFSVSSPWGALAAACAITGAISAPFGVALGQEAAAQSIEIGDRVSVTVLGQQDLSGEFPVDGAGSITLPVIGAITVQNLSTDEAAKRITGRLADGYLQRPNVSLRIIEYRPLYILGSVKSPGAYPFRYGVTVLSAVALAGGYAVPEQLSPGTRIDFLQADERLRALKASYATLLVRRARLEAEQSGSAEIRLSEIPDIDPNDADVVRILGEEQEILRQQKALHEKSLEMLQDQKPRIQAEIEGIKGQSAAENRQLELLRENIKSYDQLRAGGLALRSTWIDLKREEARHEGDLSRYASEILRLQIDIGNVDLRIQEVEGEYKRRIATELQEARSRLREVEASLPIAREVREARLQFGGAALAPLTGNPYRTITITRTSRGKNNSFQADVTTPLMPGDVIEIQQAALSGVSGPASGTGSGELPRPGALGGPEGIATKNARNTP